MKLNCEHHNTQRQPLDHLKENTSYSNHQEQLTLPYSNLINYAISQEYNLDLYGNTESMFSLANPQLRSSILVEEDSPNMKTPFVLQPERVCRSAQEDKYEERLQAIEKQLNSNTQYNKQIIQTLTKLEKKFCSKDSEEDWLLFQPHLEISRLEQSELESTSKKTLSQIKEPQVPDCVVKKRLKFQVTKENIVRKPYNPILKAIKAQTKIKHIDTANIRKGNSKYIKSKPMIKQEINLNKNLLMYFLVIIGFVVITANLIYFF